MHPKFPIRLQFALSKKFWNDEYRLKEKVMSKKKGLNIHLAKCSSVITTHKCMRPFDPTVGISARCTNTNPFHLPKKQLTNKKHIFFLKEISFIY